MRSQKRYQASITVEAVIIVPLIIVVIMTFLYLTLYLHDKAAIYSILDDAVIKENMVRKQPSNYLTGEIDYEHLNTRSLLYHFIDDCDQEEEALRRYVSERIEGKLAVSRLTNIEVTNSYTGIGVKVWGKIIFHPLPLMDFFAGHKTFCMTVDIPIHNPSDFVRISDNLLGVAEGVKYYDKIADTLQKIGSR